MENELKMKLKLKPNIGMSLHITVVDTTQKWNEIKLLNTKIEIENEVKEIKLNIKLRLKQNIGMSVWVKSSIQKMKLLNRNLVIKNEVMKNEIKVKTKHWHKCRHCSHRHRHGTKIKRNRIE